jgi:hypothetical protein
MGALAAPSPAAPAASLVPLDSAYPVVALDWLPKAIPKTNAHAITAASPPTYAIFEDSGSFWDQACSCQFLSIRAFEDVSAPRGRGLSRGGRSRLDEAVWRLGYVRQTAEPGGDLPEAAGSSR